MDGGLAQVRTPHGSAILRVRVTDGQRAGMLFAPIHWSDEIASDARVGALANACFDPFSGQPELKATPCSVSPVVRARSGFVLARRRVRLGPEPIWSWSAIEQGFASRIDTDATLDEVLASLKDGEDQETLVYEDSARGVSRAALIVDGRLAAVAFLGGGAVTWAGLLPAWTAPKLESGYRGILLSGRLEDGPASCGQTVCACFGVASDRIEAAIAAGAADVQAVGRATKAGTNCGSCIPEVRRMLAAVSVLQPEPA